MTAPDTIVEQLHRWGPERCDPTTPEEAIAICRRLTLKRRENFSVLSMLVPRPLRDDFAVVYAFCRWADDLGDEIGDRTRSMELLAWWRDELHRCYDGAPRHPVMVALARTVAVHGLPMGLFDDLIAAFERDQRQDRYETWDDLLDYCRQSANPVGRLVLMMLGEPRDEAIVTRSDAICTALQLTNHWQDIRRDRLDRNRVYIPREMNPIDDFERRLEITVRQGHAADHRFLAETRAVVRGLVERTWPLYERGSELLPMLRTPHRGLVWLFAAGGEHVLASIGDWNFETVLHRPRVSAPMRLWLVLRAWLKAQRGDGARAGDAESHRASSIGSAHG